MGISRWSELPTGERGCFTATTSFLPSSTSRMHSTATLFPRRNITPVLAISDFVIVIVIIIVLFCFSCFCWLPETLSPFLFLIVALSLMKRMRKSLRSTLCISTFFNLRSKSFKEERQNKNKSNGKKKKKKKEIGRGKKEKRIPGLDWIFFSQSSKNGTAITSRRLQSVTLASFVIGTSLALIDRV